MVTGNGQLRHALRERSAGAARFPHAYGGLLPARPGTPGIYFEYSRKLVTLVGLVCCFLGASGAEEYFFVRAGGPGRPLGAEWPLKKEITRPACTYSRQVELPPRCRRLHARRSRPGKRALRAGSHTCKEEGGEAGISAGEEPCKCSSGAFTCRSSARGRPGPVRRSSHPWSSRLANRVRSCPTDQSC